MTKKIICVHLHNDYSGSARVLSTVIKNLVATGHSVEVMTSQGTQGFLSKLEGVSYRNFGYRFYEKKLPRLGILLWSQVLLFFQELKNEGRSEIIYVNTLLPFGVALAGKLTGKRVVYHLHETTVIPPVLKYFLKKAAQFCASEVIYVSHFLQAKERLAGVPSQVIHNCLSAGFTESAAAFQHKHHKKPGPFKVMMRSSLKAYKDVNVFASLAKMLPQFRFLLVLNASYEAVHTHFNMAELPENLIIFPSQKNEHSFYQEADLMLNLSHSEQWVETFGMTLLEGMTYGLPVISPPVGGPAELVEDGFNGFKIDQGNLAEIAKHLREIGRDKVLYHRLSVNAKAFAAGFGERDFRKKILLAILPQAVQSARVMTLKTEGVMI